MRDIEFQRFLVVAAHLHGHILLGNLRHRGVHRRPFAPRAAINLLTDRREQLFRPIAQGLFDDRVGLIPPQLGAQRLQHRYQHLRLDARLVEQRQLGIDQIIVEHAHLCFLRKRR